MKTKARTFLLCIATLSLASACVGQQFKMSALQVTRSEFVDGLKKLRKDNAALSPDELAKAANELMDRNGLPFAIMFDAATCERIRKVKQEMKDPNGTVRVGATLRSVGADGATLALPEPKLAPANCGDCYVELPLLEVTSTDFVTKLMGQNIKFQLPSNFLMNEAVLFDADGTAVKRKWRLPFRAVPIGVSYEENVLYLGFPEPELADLSLLVFSEGVFQIGTRNEAEDGGKGSPVTARTSDGLSKIKFDRWSRSYVIGYRDPCN